MHRVNKSKNLPVAVLLKDKNMRNTEGSDEWGLMGNICYLYVAGGLARARQFRVILASGDSSG